MAVTATDLQGFVGAGSEDGAFLSSCLSTAKTLVDDFVGDNVVPEPVKDRCYLTVGSELFHARNAPNGIAQYNEFNGAPVRIARDPMIAVYALLGNYMVVGL